MSGVELVGRCSSKIERERERERERCEGIRVIIP